MGVVAYSRLGAYELFLPLDVRLFELGANSWLGTYSNKHGTSLRSTKVGIKFGK